MEDLVKIVTKSIIFCMKGLMALSLNLSFNPLNAAWNPTVLVDDLLLTSDTGSGPVLSVNSSNDGVAVYLKNSAQFPQSTVNLNIMAASYYYGTGWTTPVIISDTSLVAPFTFRRYINQGDPDIRINESGYAIAVWEGTRNDDVGNQQSVILSATRSSNGTWSPVQTVQIGPELNFFAENPVVDVNESGLGVAVWNEVRGANDEYFIMTSFLPINGNWTPAVQLDGPSTVSDQDDNTIDVEINNNGNAVAVWLMGDRPSNYAVHAATYDAATGVWTTVSLDENPAELTEPKVDMDDNGNAVAVWERFNGTDAEIVASSYTVAAGWSPYVVLDTSLNDVNSPYVVMDQFGTATAVWNKEVEEFAPSQVFASRRPLGGTWSAPTFIANGEVVPENTQKTADVDDFGNVVVIVNVDQILLQSVLYTVQVGWQAPENISSGPIRIDYPNIGIGSCGFALALWERTVSEGPQGPEIVVEASDNFQLMNYVSPPSNFVGTRCCNKFATQKSCLIRLSFSPVDCAASYVLRRNGVIIATIPAGGSTSFEDPVCSKNPSVYTLTVISVNGVESQPTTITML